MTYHIEVLKKDFENRLKKNSRFSLRSYASKLEMHPSALSRILAGKQELSPQFGVAIAEKLNLSKDQTRRFLHSIIESRKQRDSEKLGKAINAPDLSLRPVEVSFDDYKTMACLDAAAILELTQTEDCRNDWTWIAERIGASETRVRDILSALVNNGILKIDGDLICKTDTHTTTLTQTAQTSEVARAHQAEILERACHALENIPFGKRANYGMAMAINPEKIPEAITRIKKFLGEICDELQVGPCTEVYQLGVQLFPLTKRKS